MQTTRRKKLEIFIESTYVRTLLKVLSKNKVETYACLPTEHYHNKQITSIEDDIIDVFEFSKCIAIVDLESYATIVGEINKVLTRANGVLYSHDVEEITGS